MEPRLILRKMFDEFLSDGFLPDPLPSEIVSFDFGRRINSVVHLMQHFVTDADIRSRDAELDLAMRENLKNEICSILAEV